MEMFCRYLGGLLLGSGPGREVSLVEVLEVMLGSGQTVGGGWGGSHSTAHHAARGSCALHYQHTRLLHTM